MSLTEELGQSDLENLSWSSELADSSQNSPTSFASPMSYSQPQYGMPYPNSQSYYGQMEFNEPPLKRPRLLIEPVVMEDEERRLQNAAMGMNTIIQPLEVRSCLSYYL